MKNSAKTAGSKLSSYEAGQIVRGLDFSAYRVVSKVAGPEGAVVKLANLQGEPVSLPADFTPVGTRMAHLASAMFFHLAYNRDFDLYVRAYCERAGLPIPVGPDGKPFKWSNWLQATVSPKLIVPGQTGEDAQSVKDEAIHEMLFTELGHRNILGKFQQAIKNFPKDIQKLPVGNQLTVYLTKTFRGRVEEMNRKIKGINNPDDEVSMVQDNGDEEEFNILDNAEFGQQDDAYQQAESEHDITKFRNAFYEWLKKKETEKSAKWFISLFDIYWQWINESSENVDEEGRPSYMPARRHLEPEWAEKTNLSNASLYDYIGRLSKLLAAFIQENRTSLGEDNVFVKLLNGINRQREQIKKKQKPKQKAMPAHASLAALNVAAAVYNGPHDPNIPFSDNAKAPEGELPVELKAPRFPEKGLGQCACEWEACPGNHPAGGCQNPASNIVRVLTHKTRLCQGCMDAVRDFLSAEHGDVSLGPAELDDDLFQIISSDQGMEPVTGGSPAMSLEDLHKRMSAQDSYCDACDRPESSCVCDTKECDQTRKRGSTGAECSIIEYKPGEWYYILERRGYEEDYESPWDWRDNADAYGPFKTEEEAIKHLGDEHANPGGWSVDKYRERKPDATLDKLIAQAPKNTRPPRSSGYGRRWGSVTKIAKLVRGDELTPEMIEQIKDAFIYRWTVDNNQRTQVYHCDKCDIQNPYVNPSSAEGHSHPTIPLQTDQEWTRDHAFYFTNDGRLMARRSAEPIYLAKGSDQARLPLEVSAKTGAGVDDKKEQLREDLKKGGPGLNGYAYNAAVYCPECGEAIIDELIDSNSLPIHGDDDPASTMTGWMYDTETIPQPIFFGESDSAEHCDNCGEYCYGPEQDDEEKSCDECGAKPGRHYENCPVLTEAMEQYNNPFTPEDKWYLEQMKIKGSKKAEFLENLMPADLPGPEQWEKDEQDHLYCPECKECVTCNLRPCRNGGEHKPGVPLSQKWGSEESKAYCPVCNEELEFRDGVYWHVNGRTVDNPTGRKINHVNLRAPEDVVFKNAASRHTGMTAAQKFECCGSVSGHHKSDCPVYNANFDKTMDMLKALPKRSADESELVEAAGNILEARGDQMLTSEDWKLLGEAIMVSAVGSGMEELGAQHGPNSIVHPARALLTAAQNLVKAKKNQMVTAEEWDALQKAYQEATGQFVNWRTHDEQADIDEGSKEAHGSGPVTNFTDKAATKEGDDMADEKMRALLQRAADSLQDYCAEANGDMNDSLAMEIEAYLTGNPNHPFPPKQSAMDEKTWECRNCDAWGTDPQSGVEHSTQRNHGIRNLKDAAGPVSPQQMQQMQVQKSQGVEPQGEQSEAQPPVSPNNPAFAIMPDSGSGENMPEKKTVPPEIPNPNYHMGHEEKTAMLKTEMNTPEMEQEVEHLIATYPSTEVHKGCTPVFEHGQWWVTCGPCGAIWSIVDAEGGQSINGLDLEEIEYGNESCYAEYSDEHMSADKTAGDDAVFADKKKFFESVKHKHHVK